MRGGVVCLFVVAALARSTAALAQPAVTAQASEWQVQSEPIVVNGLVYYPTRGTRFFDREIMAQVGVYQSVPIYADVTLEPHSVIYVPVGRQMMRAYERRREGELAGTSGSRVPSFPVEIKSGTHRPEDRTVTVGTPVGTGGTVASPFSPTDVPRSTRTHVESIPPPRSNQGIWVEYAGAKWYLDGAAVPFDADRFFQIGVYRGFPVYRDTDRGSEEIWVRVVADGPVAPYVRR